MVISEFVYTQATEVDSIDYIYMGYYIYYYILPYYIYIWEKREGEVFNYLIIFYLNLKNRMEERDGAKPS